MAAIDLNAQITTYPGSYLLTCTNANVAYVLTLPVGLRVRVTVQPHVNTAAVHFLNTAADQDAITVLDGLVIGALGTASFIAGRADNASAVTAAGQFVVGSASAGTKVLITLEMEPSR